MIYKEYKEIFDKNVMIVEANDKTLKLSNGYYIVSKQIGECCEINYLDFAAVMDTVLIGQPIKYLHIEISKNLLGIRINKEFIPAYSLQNGYYDPNVGIDLYNKENRLIFSTEVNEIAAEII